MDTSKDDINSASLKINGIKLKKFQQWCSKSQLNYIRVIENIIDACLEDNQVIIDTIIHQKDNVNLEEKIHLIVSESLQPLMDRIEVLESQLTNKNNHLSEENKSNCPPLLSDSSLQDISKRVYLPRQEVWQRLKKTDYIKYSGYDSFLKVKGNELIEYDIFFDEDKKRFYIISDDLLPLNF